MYCAHRKSLVPGLGDHEKKKSRPLMLNLTETLFSCSCLFHKVRIIMLDVVSRLRYSYVRYIYINESNWVRLLHLFHLMVEALPPSETLYNLNTPNVMDSIQHEDFITRNRPSSQILIGSPIRIVNPNTIGFRHLSALFSDKYRAPCCILILRFRIVHS
jgi:hypothetical protein